MKKKEKKSSGKGSVFKKVLVTLLIIILILVLIAGIYVMYLMIDYHRIGDKTLIPEGEAAEKAIKTGKEYSIVSYNIGFGAYEDDYGFFMDGGEQSRVWSKERLDKNLKNISDFLNGRNADLCLVQEVDIDSTRSEHVDERIYLKQEGKASIFAQNYDSPYLFYPILEPHGASKSGIMTFSSFPIASANRVELPVETGITKFLDLDRCYSKARIPVEGGRDLILYNFHLSAYTTDGTIANEQIEMLLSDMQSEYKAGNYAIAGGDFNKDILGDSSKYFGRSDKEYTWAQPIPEELFKDVDIKLVAPLDESDPVPSCRNADGPYKKGQFVLTIDGFLVSPNVGVKSSEVINLSFKYSDHNPVTMTFTLGDAK